MNKKLDNTLQRKPLLLCVMDGWGYSPNNFKNAIKEAKTPNFDNYIEKYPSTLLKASGEDVGLPKGQVGNSEVGHMNIGAGRVVKQYLMRIDEAIDNKNLNNHYLLENFSNSLKKSKGSAHLLGLISDGGVHSSYLHVLELARILTRRDIKVFIHVFTDGRDTLPKSANNILQDFEKRIPKGSYIATVTGRFYSMDRDFRWERIEEAWKAIVKAETKFISKSSKDAVLKAYERGETDEFISPTLIQDISDGKFNGINNGDGIISANFRSDRMRQILSSLIDDDFKKFSRDRKPQFSSLLGMVPYSDRISKKMFSLFTKEIPLNTIGEVISKAGLNQLRIAETEKYPHVTFFLNGGKEKTFDGEERYMVSSPKVKTYDECPEMGAKEIAGKIISSLSLESNDLIIANFANPDMVGHTGNFKAVVNAVEYVDKYVGLIIKDILRYKGTVVLTSDHGNCEQMWDDREKSAHTAHTNNLVPLIIIDEKMNYNLKQGCLADIAPTVLQLLNIKKPKQMSGNSLII